MAGEGGPDRGGPFPLGAAVTVADLDGDAHPLLHRLRAAEPVSWLPAVGGWLVTRHDLALAVMRDAVGFTVDDPRFSTAQVVGPSMLSLDGPEHERHRSAYAGVVRPRDVAERFAPFVSTVVEGRLAAIRERGHADLRTELAAPLAASVVAQALGLDGGDDAAVGRLVGWYRAIVASVSAISAGSAPTPAGAEAMAALGEHLRGHLPPGGGLSTE